MFLRRSRAPWPNCFLARSNCPAWKWLASDTLASYERISLITMIFSDRDQIKTVRNLSGDDAQTFIDKIDEVILPISCSKEKLIDFDPNPHICQLGVEQFRTTNPQEVSALLV